MCNPTISFHAVALSLWHFVIGTFSVSLGVVHTFSACLVCPWGPCLPQLPGFTVWAGLTPCLTSVGGQETHSQATEALLALAP